MAPCFLIARLILFVFLYLLKRIGNVNLGYIRPLETESSIRHIRSPSYVPSGPLYGGSTVIKGPSYRRSITTLDREDMIGQNLSRQ